MPEEKKQILGAVVLDTASVDDSRILVVRSIGHPDLEPDVRQYAEDALRPDEEVSGEEARRARAKLEFQCPDWSLGNALSWIAFRDTALICRFESCWVNSRRLESRQRLLLYGRRSTGKKRPLMLVTKPDQALLAALQARKLVAIRNGAEIPSSHWFGNDTRHLSDNLRFRRAEVMVIDWWSAEGDEGAKAAAAEAETPDVVDSRPESSPKRHRGPQAGTVDRYSAADRALFPHIARIMQKDRVSAFAAALKLAERLIEGIEVEGAGTPKSRAKRLVSRYLEAKRKSASTETC